MSINVEVERTGSENSTSLLRRFTRKVQGAGILPRMKSDRYFKRSPSAYTKKKQALKKIARRAAYRELVKLGKVEERPQRRGRR